jgi:hypothetical protein
MKFQPEFVQDFGYIHEVIQLPAYA